MNSNVVCKQPWSLKLTNGYKRKEFLVAKEGPVNKNRGYALDSPDEFLFFTRRLIGF